jgi:hypothetical protein
MVLPFEANDYCRTEFLGSLQLISHDIGALDSLQLQINAKEKLTTF